MTCDPTKTRMSRDITRYLPGLGRMHSSGSGLWTPPSVMLGRFHQVAGNCGRTFSRGFATENWIFANATYGLQNSKSRSSQHTNVLNSIRKGPKESAVGYLT